MNHQNRQKQKFAIQACILIALLTVLGLCFFPLLHARAFAASHGRTVATTLKVNRGTPHTGGAAKIGATVTVSGTGFGAKETIILTLNGGIISTTPAPLHAFSDGSFNATFVVPALPIRTYPLIASGQTSGTSASIIFWLQAPAENIYEPLSSQATYHITDPDSREPQMQYLRITNTGDANLIAPGILPDSVSNMYPIVDTASLPSIVNGILAAHPEAVSDAQKAYALWQWLVEETYHWNDAQNDNRVNQMDVIGVLNNYGYMHCWDHSRFLADMFQTAGYQARAWNLGGHAVTEVYYGGAWHVYDADLQKIYLSAGSTVAGEQSLVSNPDPIYLNTSMDGKSVVTGVGLYTAPHVANLYATTADNASLGNVFPPASHPVGVTLRKNETLMENWSNVGKYHDNNLHSAPPVYTNGDIVYVPDLSQISYHTGTFTQVNIASSSQDGMHPNLHSETTGSTSSVIYQVTSPYTLVGSLLSAQTYMATSSDALSIYFSLDGSNWGNPMYTQSRPGYDNPQIDLSSFLNNGILAEQYRYYIKFQWRANSAANGAGVDSFSLDSQFEQAWEVLPPIHSGTTSITYTDQMNTTYAPGTVQVAYGWIPQPSSANLSRSALTADYTSIPANGTTFARVSLILKTSAGVRVPNMFVQLIPGAGQQVQIQQAYKYQSTRGETNSTGQSLFVVRSNRVGDVTLTASDKNGNPLGIPPLTIHFTPPQSSASLTASQGSAILNGGFGTGDFTDWTTGGTTAPTINTANAYGSSYSAQLGAATPSGAPTNSSIMETLIIPSTANSLSFAYQLVNPNTDANNDIEIWVRDTDGEGLFKLFSSSTGSAGWQTQAITYVQKYRGNTVQIYFTLHQDGSANPAYAYLDEISLQ